MRPPSSQHPPWIRLGLCGVALPNTVVLDWSYCWGEADRRRNQFPQKTIIEIVIEVVNDLGSVAAYDPIPAAKLRIWTYGCADAPETWPYLLDVRDEDVYSFGCLLGEGSGIQGANVNG